LRQCQQVLAFGVLASIARKPAEKHLRQRFKEALNFPPAARLADRGENKPDFQVGRHLLQMLRGEIAAMIGVEHLGDAADMPAGLGLAPDRLAKRQGRLNGRRGGEKEQIAGDSAAVIIEDDGQPRLAGLVLVVFDQDLELGVIGLPGGVGRLGVPAMHEVEGVAVGLGALMS
jgi:hypothetical protein